MASRKTLRKIVDNALKKADSVALIIQYPIDIARLNRK